MGLDAFDQSAAGALIASGLDARSGELILSAEITAHSKNNGPVLVSPVCGGGSGTRNFSTSILGAKLQTPDRVASVTAITDTGIGPKITIVSSCVIDEGCSRLTPGFAPGTDGDDGSQGAGISESGSAGAWVYNVTFYIGVFDPDLTKYYAVGVDKCNFAVVLA